VSMPHAHVGQQDHDPAHRRDTFRNVFLLVFSA
jgi:hypothetical protein